MPQPVPTMAPRRRGRPAGQPSGSSRRRGRPVGSGTRHPRPLAPPPPQSSWPIFYGGDSQNLTIMLKSSEDLMESALKESRVLQINLAQGQLSLVTLTPEGRSSTSPRSCEDWWEILSLTGVFVPNKSVGMNHPMGGMTIRVRGAGEAIQGRIGGSVIVATAVVVCLTTYDLHGEEKRKRQHTAGPGAAGPNASTKGELPSVHEAQTGGEELAAAGPEAQKGGEEQPS